MSGSRYSVQTDASNLNTSHGLMIKLIGGSKRVLDIGCAEGDLARALSDRGCAVSGVEHDPSAAAKADPSLERLVIADLATLDLRAEFGRSSFDVVVMGDVLEHLVDPDTVLRQARDLLRPGGRVVVSIPNVAHAAVRLSLLLGRWDYQPLGLLDATHVRFFTRKSVLSMLDSCGFQPLEIERTTLGPFGTEIALEPDEIDPSVVEAVLEDPDATTYQFVLSAVRSDDDSEMVRLRMQQQESQRVAERLAANLSEVRDQAAGAQRVADAQAAAAENAASALRQRLAAAQAAADRAEAAVIAIKTSTSWRVGAPVRAVAPFKSRLKQATAAVASLRHHAGGG